MPGRLGKIALSVAEIKTIKTTSMKASKPFTLSDQSTSQRQTAPNVAAAIPILGMLAE